MNFTFKSAEAGELRKDDEEDTEEEDGVADHPDWLELYLPPVIDDQ